jgi:hypothetical protein
VKMQSWLNLMQLEQRPSSVASKPEHRIWLGKREVSSIASHWKYLAASAVAAGNGSALARSWRLVVRLDILRWRRALLLIWMLGRRPALPLVGAGQAVGLLVLRMLRMLVGSHVGSRLVGRRWERRAHLVDVRCQRRRGRLTVCSADYLRGPVADRSRGRVAARLVVANGWGAALDRLGEETFRRRWPGAAV